MKKAKSRTRERELRPECDFSEGVRGRYAKRYAQGTNLVKVEPDVAAVFRDSTSVNRALCTLTEVARRVSQP